MPRFSRSRQIDAPMDVVFGHLTDLDRLPTWMPAIIRTEPLDDGPMRVGWRFRETRTIGKRGKEASSDIEVSGYEPPLYYALTSRRMGVEATYHFSLVDEAGGTHVELVADTRGRWYWRPFLPLLCRMMEREDGDMLDALARAVEGSVTPR